MVALTMFDLRRRSKVDRVGMCGVNVSRHEKAKNVNPKYCSEAFDLDANLVIDLTLSPFV